MDVRKLTVGCLARQLSECNQEAEIRVVIGSVPQALPVSKIAIRENIDNEEIVALVIDHNTFVDALDYSIELMEGIN